MTTMTQTQVAAALGINMLALWSLTGNPAFPAPASNDGDGNVDVADHGGHRLHRAVDGGALANGRQLPTAILPSANFSAMAAAAPGGYYANRPGSDPLFDDYL